VKALEGGNGETFNIASREPITDYETLSAVCKALNIFHLQTDLHRERPGGIDQSYLKMIRPNSY
jgi:hypothetical protein